MSEAQPERAQLSPEERAEQIRLAKERAASARAARESGVAPAQAESAAAASAETGVPEPAAAIPTATAPAAAAASVPAAERAAPASPADRAAAIQAAKERAAAARAAKEGGAVPTPVAEAPAAQAASPSAAAAPAARAERAAPATPEERAAAIRAAKERAAAARAGGGAAVQPAAAPAAPRPALSPEQRAAALAQAQERAAAVKAQRASAAPAAKVAAPPPPATWRVVANGKAQPIAAARPEPRAQAIAQMDRASRLVMRRRQFLRGGFWAGAAVLAAGSLAAFLDFFNPRDITGFGGVVTVPASDVPPPGGDPIHYLEAKIWVANLKAGEGVVGGIGTPGPAGVLALYQKCPHLGCTVPWRSDFNFLDHTGWFRCPCHGSTYTKAGYRVFGPAPHSMWTFPVKVGSGGSLSVNTGKISNGNLIQATTTVPYHT
jgi:cytochrome b6-f complex iron-sulfur subunit